ncbi:MAG: CARDB domain-containing protein, partial [Planctomycetia bacterium]|nr:CARDB domain-containing protein [Planctomycetia bacterium]
MQRKSFLNAFLSSISKKQTARYAKSYIPSRLLRLESLEERQLLSVTTVEYDQIRNDYPSFQLSENINDNNIIELTSLNATNLQNAINLAAQTDLDDLIILRASESLSEIQIDSTLSINLDSSKSGTLTIVAAESNMPIKLNAEFQSILNIESGIVQIGGLEFLSQTAQFDRSNPLPNSISVANNAQLMTENVFFNLLSEPVVCSITMSDGSTFNNIVENPDLTFYQPTGWGSSVLISSDPDHFMGDTQFESGQNLFLDFSLYNQGNSDANDFDISIKIDGETISTFSALSLQKWELSSLHNLALGQLPVGSHVLQITLDSEAAVAEEFENNNLYNLTFEVVDQLDTPESPKNVSLKNSNDAIQILSWDASPHATQYLVEYQSAETGQNKTIWVAGTSLALSDLINNENSVKVTAINASHQSDPASINSLSFAKSIESDLPSNGSTSPNISTTDPYNIECEIKTSGNVEVLSQNGIIEYAAYQYVDVPDPIYLTILDNACKRWEEIITEGLPAVEYVDRTIDDMFLNFGFVYEESSMLGGAINLRYRRDNGVGLSATGSIMYNSYFYGANPDESLQNNFYNTVLHEIGHSLGYETGTWDLLNIYTEKQETPGNLSDLFYTYQESGWSFPYYNGNHGASALHDIMGDHMPFASSSEMLMETITSPGSYGSHISSIYGTFYNFLGQSELMNYYSDFGSGTTPLSTVSIGILEDVGYTVDYAMADPWGSIAPTNLQASVLGNTVSLTWSVNSENIKADTTYSVQRLNTSVANANWETLSSSVTTTSYVDSTVAADTSYQYRIIANNLQAPVVAALQTVNGNATFSWNPVSSASSYTVYGLICDYNSDSYNSMYWVLASSNTQATSYNNPLSYETYFLVVANEANQTVSAPSKAVRVSIEAVPQKPDLIPFTPSNWSGPLVVSNSNNATISTENLNTEDNVYVNFCIANSGNVDIANDFVVTLSLTGSAERSQEWTINGLENLSYVDATSSVWDLGLLEAGSYTITMTIDSTGVVDEESKDNNSASYSFTITVLEKADLIPYTPQGWSGPVVVTNTTASTISSDNILPVDNVYVNFSIANYSNVDIAIPFEVKLELSTSNGVLKSQSWNVTRLSAMSYVTATSILWDLGQLEAESYTVKMTIDPNDAINESDKSNNTVTYSFDVISDEKPDLIPLAPEGWSGPIVVAKSENTTTSDTSFTSNDNIYIKTSVFNDSLFNVAKTFYVAVNVDEAHLSKSYTVNGLQGNQYACTDNVWNIGKLFPGTYTITLIIDRKGAIDESNEDNNTITYTFTVLETSIVVDSTEDTVDATDGKTTLREAIAMAQAGETITFASSLAGKTITLSGEQLDIKDGITIDASLLRTEGITISGANKSNIFNVTG